MIASELDTENSVLTIRPQSSLSEGDFAQIAEQVDPFIESSGELRGLIIESPSFPGWENFSAMTAHLRFVRDHHQKIRRVALVTDSVIGDLAENLASHFVAAEIKHFPADEVATAKQWVSSDT